MLHLVWAGGGFRAVARLVLAEVHLLIVKNGLTANERRRR
jgi:hypothetical protein